MFVYLVRHGRASLFKDSYDSLSDDGKEQAAKLASFFKASGIQIQLAITGTMERQKDTGNAICEALGLDNRLVWPELNEFDERVWVDIAKAKAEKVAPFGAQLGKYAEWKSMRNPRARRMFYLLSEAVITSWVTDEFPDLSIEKFSEFTERVTSIPEKLKSLPELRGKQKGVLLTTSATPISLLCGLALQMTPAASLGFMKVLYNSSLSVLSLEPRNLGLITFNAIPHLKVSELSLV